MWQQYLSSDYGDEGYGEVTETTVIVQYVEPAHEAPPIDDADAEDLQDWIRQLYSGHKAALNRRYVIREQKVEKDRVDSAIRALMGLMDGRRA